MKNRMTQLELNFNCPSEDKESHSDKLERMKYEYELKKFYSTLKPLAKALNQQSTNLEDS